VGKISHALEKYRKERTASGSPGRIQSSDWALLLKYNRTSGRLDIQKADAVNNSDALKRLAFYRLIQKNGALTPAGLAKCAELENRTKSSAEGIRHRKPGMDPERTAVLDKLRDADWVVMMQYDRQTGNILKYDPETGQLDERSRAILKNPDIIQRLIDSNMILPGGWLTAAAKRECQEREPEPKKPVIGRSLDRNKKENKIKSPAPEVSDRAKKGMETRRAIPLKPENKDEIKPRRVVPEEKKQPAAAPPTSHKPKAVDNNLVSLLDPSSFEAEQFKILRTNILYPISGKAPQSVLVSSSVPGEGKSFVAANLAVSIAMEINRYVLLIDCDLRMPAIHRLFGFGRVPGLSNYLSNGTPVESLLLRTPVDKLTILPAGPVPDNPSELISSNQMSRLLQEVSGRYSDRIIIIDSTPPKITAEAHVLAGQVDGVLLVLKHGSTKKELVAELVQKMGSHKILGAVMNDCDILSSGYYSKAYRKYAGKYGRPNKHKEDA
jgi:protein-tyrosine kinase